LLLHVAVGGQTPQSTLVPHTSAALPHTRPWSAQTVFGSIAVHRLATPPVAHSFPVGQPPQSTVPPQPSVTNPHWFPRSAQAWVFERTTQAPPLFAGAGSQVLNEVLQTWPSAQDPQSVSVVAGPQPSHAWPHAIPMALHAAEASTGKVQGTH
jgi:hypothetical protein